ncbi:hypothetical protein GRB07_13605 [Yersinia pestis]|nr:hypothetical protein [Yersinia pseudotuberculosis]NBG69664.1 hypothetical protein [Yersinia pestis]NBG73892.1 hypothetical protein [Yersinia pestis]NBG77738.1 hypothetical protein [Yersinia pestis]NWN36658.1 hypothetical protein [Yersinia pestis]
MDVFTASLRSVCSLRRGHFVNNLEPAPAGFLLSVNRKPDRRKNVTHWQHIISVIGRQ